MRKLRSLGRAWVNIPLTARLQVKPFSCRGVLSACLLTASPTQLLWKAGAFLLLFSPLSALETQPGFKDLLNKLNYMLHSRYYAKEILISLRSPKKTNLLQWKARVRVYSFSYLICIVFSKWGIRTTLLTLTSAKTITGKGQGERPLYPMSMLPWEPGGQHAAPGFPRLLWPPQRLQFSQSISCLLTS